MHQHVYVCVSVSDLCFRKYYVYACTCHKTYLVGKARGTRCVSTCHSEAVFHRALSSVMFWERL